jgi:hypothetical protein
LQGLILSNALRA